uniref:retron system putative HNH endonuclease n=1 Tax=Lachnospira eligens TaxID=39485 RepID=UPI003FF03370
MIHIKKSREPGELIQYRKQSGATYENMSSDLKQKITESLLKEQGHLCAYCMRKIPENRKLPTGVKPVTIEHWYPRNPQSNEDIGQGLNYKNMLAVCSGNRGCGNERNMTCDAHRKNKKIKVNPCEPETLLTIKYDAQGRIYSTDKDIDDDINNKLNLNCGALSLPENRKMALNALIMMIHQKYPDGDISQYCDMLIKKFEETTDYKTPFVGILLFWLKKHSGGNR